MSHIVRGTSVATKLLPSSSSTCLELCTCLDKSTSISLQTWHVYLHQVSHGGWLQVSRCLFIIRNGGETRVYVWNVSDIPHSA